jgi:hypothetical protein
MGGFAARVLLIGCLAWGVSAAATECSAPGASSEQKVELGADSQSLGSSAVPLSGFRRFTARPSQQLILPTPSAAFSVPCREMPAQLSGLDLRASALLQRTARRAAPALPDPEVEPNVLPPLRVRESHLFSARARRSLLTQNSPDVSMPEGLQLREQSVRTRTWDTPTILLELAAGRGVVATEQPRCPAVGEEHR